MKCLITVLFLLFLDLHCRSQSITWEKQFHFDEANGGHMALQTEDGGYLIPTGIGNDTALIGALWIVKLDKYGNFQWKKIIDTSSGTRIFIQKTSHLFSVVDFGGVHNDWNNIDFDENGDVLWEKRQSQDSVNFLITGILSLSGGNYVTQGFFGNELKNNLTASFMIVQKYNVLHQIVWSDTFKFAPSMGGYGPLLKTRNNKLLISGSAGSGGIFNDFAYLLLLDTNGKNINYVQYPYTADSTEYMSYVAQFPNGNIILQSGDISFNEYFTLADSVGNTLKRWELKEGYPNGIGGIATDGDSVYVVADFGLDAGPYSLVKYDTGFNLMWEKDYDNYSDPYYGAYYNYAGGILRTSDNGLLLTGARSLVTAPGEPSDMVAIKLDANGNLANADYAGINNTLPNNGISVYPNPATDNIYINTQSINAALCLDIFDSKGVRAITQTGLSPGVQAINVSLLSKGLYMYRLYHENNIYCEGKFVKE